MTAYDWARHTYDTMREAYGDDTGEAVRLFQLESLPLFFHIMMNVIESSND
jgi:hypothetical protein